MDKSVLTMKMKSDMKTMKGIIPMAFAALLAGLVCSPVLVAQTEGRPDGVDREALRERMEVMAVGFLTEELDLDAESAQVFWPIYNAHKAELKESMDALQEAQNAMENLGTGADDQFYDALDRIEEAEVVVPRLRAEFLREVAAEFGSDFAVRCIQAQKKFKRVVRDRMQQRMSDKDRRALGKMGRGPGRQRR